MICRMGWKDHNWPRLEQCKLRIRDGRVALKLTCSVKHGWNVTCFLMYSAEQQFSTYGSCGCPVLDMGSRKRLRCVVVSKIMFLKRLQISCFRPIIFCRILQSEDKRTNLKTVVICTQLNLLNNFIGVNDSLLRLCHQPTAGRYVNSGSKMFSRYFFRVYLPYT
jgi:hypothetical protein